MITNKGCKRLRDLEKKVDSGAGGGKLFVAKFTESNGEFFCDKSYEEINEAYENGETVAFEFYSRTDAGLVYRELAGKQEMEGKDPEEDSEIIYDARKTIYVQGIPPFSQSYIELYSIGISKEEVYIDVVTRQLS